MNKLISLLLIIILSSCLVKRRSNHYSVNPVEFKNQNLTNIKPDSQVINDKYFRIILPEKVKKNSLIIGVGFLHILNFDHIQKILILYLPLRINLYQVKHPNLSYNEFIDLCQKCKIFNFLKKIKYSKNQNFGFNKVRSEGEFY